MKIAKYLKKLFINMALYLDIFFLIQLQIVTKNFEKIHQSKKKDVVDSFRKYALSTLICRR